ncbi:MAG: sporulation protein YunB [Oscillospiraceae bacterium]|jgi:sporulation protein YunB|nr:sporulation protein YunB [Oscillospiraceae bacterium]
MKGVYVVVLCPEGERILTKYRSLSKRRGSFKRHWFWKRILIFVLILSAAGVFLDMSIRPLIKVVVAKQAETISTTIVNETITKELSENAVNYSDLVKIERNKEGKILAVDTNVQQANLLKSKIVAAVQRELANTDSREFIVPFGSLTGSHIFDSRGPEIPLKISICGSINANFNSTFTEAGINQTKHQISLEISTEILGLVPGYPVNTGIKTNMLVAETLIVGEVPQIFANFGDGSNLFKNQMKPQS